MLIRHKRAALALFSLATLRAHAFGTLPCFGPTGLLGRHGQLGSHGPLSRPPIKPPPCGSRAMSAAASGAGDGEVLAIAEPSPVNRSRTRANRAGASDGVRRIECFCGECSVLASGDPVGGQTS
jgi:hypothetical protein